MKTRTVVSLLSLTVGFGLASALDVCASGPINVKIGVTSQDSSADGAYQEAAAAVLGSANSYWNEFGFVSSTPYQAAVVDASGAAVAGVTVTVQNSSGVGHLSLSGNPGFLMNDMPYMNPGGVFTITWAGLAASSQYEFVGYAANPGWPLGANWNVTTGTLNSGVTQNNGTSADITTGVGKAYSDFFATTDAAGNLVIQESSLTGTYPVLQGFQLQAAVVPEPSVLALGLLGFVALVSKRR